MYFESIEELVKNMMEDNPQDRPKCRDILNNYDKWFLPIVKSNDFLLNEKPEYESLNTYTLYHLTIL